MKMKFTAVTVLLLLTVITVKAQIGVLGGINFQNINGKDSGGEKLDNGLMIGFNAGLNYSINIAPDFYIQPGILFSVKGSKSNTSLLVFKSTGDYNTRTSLSYLEVPLNVLYSPKVGSGKVLLGFGPYVAYGVTGKQRYEIGDNVFETKVKFKNSVMSGDDLVNYVYYRPFDAGANIFFGYELAMGVFVQLNAQLGMLKINPSFYWEDTDTPKAFRNTGFGLSAGFRF